MGGGERFLTDGKGILWCLRQCPTIGENTLISILVVVLVISVYGCFAGRSLFESGRVCFSFPALPKILGFLEGGMPLRIDQNGSLILFDRFDLFDCVKMARFWMLRCLRRIFLSYLYKVS